ncbi:hypothetical protein M8542_34075 [Amycolatopsis sp. OK19-0408]|uniref:Uncharacterized protein n=1 Tax=Amycolatopsis iheyensis TaxID=2945988 RepID=A0A9X2NI48_9PSEU|nr:hypothetical protein [Amycolatopsis iheyensis]MCR6487866.1 hypothetical protein [Amycolatopsis iheyensis]
MVASFVIGGDSLRRSGFDVNDGTKPVSAGYPAKVVNSIQGSCAAAKTRIIGA